jgi:hypothetical protein
MSKPEETDDTLDRRTLLGATVAWAALTLSACSDKGSSGGTGGTSGGATGGVNGTTGSGGSHASGTGGTSAGTGGTSAGTGGTTAGTGGANAGTGGANAGTGGANAGSGGVADTGGSGGGGAGGMDDGGGTTYACTHSMTGSHTHPLTIPGSDVERGYQDAPYLLEDGGTGHTHALTLTAYDFAYLQAGATQMVDSSTTLGHLHTCSIACTRG